MAFKDIERWPEEPDDDGHGSSFDQHLQLVLSCVIDFAYQKRYRFITVEHVVLLLLQYIWKLELVQLQPDEQATMQMELYAHVQQASTIVPFGEDVQPVWAWNMRRAATFSMQAAHPEPATLLDFIYAICRQNDTYASRLLRRYGITNARFRSLYRKRR